MEVKKQLVAHYKGLDIVMISLISDAGTIVNIINYGATIKDFLMPGANGIANLVLTYKQVEDYFNDDHYLGCIVGRYANRIAGGLLKIDKKTYQLAINEAENNNHLHGGFEGFNKKVWQVAKTSQSQTTASVTLSFLSPHLDEGFPGNLQVEVTYTLSNQDELQIDYKAITDMPTVVNLTNHSYFNLSGGETDISSYLLTVHADAYTPTNDQYIPSGKLEPVMGSFYDMRVLKNINEFMHEVPTLNYCLNKPGEYKQAATVVDPVSNMQLEVKTTNPGLQLYFGNYLNDQHKPFYGICLEPHSYPDSPNQPHFPSTLLLPGQTYQETTTYKFSKRGQDDIS